MTIYGKALTWDELADIYDKEHKGGRPARTLPMDSVFAWAERQTDKFVIHPENDTLHLIMEKEAV